MTTDEMDVEVRRQEGRRLSQMEQGERKLKNAQIICIQESADLRGAHKSGQCKN